MTRVREDAARWFARMRNAEVDDPRRSLFESWLTSDPAHAREYAAFEAMWRRLDDLQGWETIDRGMTQRGKRRRLLKGGLGAAVLALVGGLGRWWWLDAPVWEMAWQTGKGEIMHEILNDGSRLALAAGSEASGVYTRRERRVSLKRGEAAFEVRHDPAWPFVVDAGELRVTVLGTRFAVSRLAGRTRVSVERGQVRVESGNARARQVLFLQDGGVAELTLSPAGPGKLRPAARAAGGAFAFEQGFIDLQNADLAEIAETFSRYCRAPVRVEPGAGRDPRITASVNMKDAESFLQLLPRMSAIAVRRTGDGTILLSAR